mgnify:CR=1 FL=1
MKHFILSLLLLSVLALTSCSVLVKNNLSKLSQLTSNQSITGPETENIKREITNVYSRGTYNAGAHDEEDKPKKKNPYYKYKMPQLKRGELADGCLNDQEF